jgi:hypothetical protein
MVNDMQTLKADIAFMRALTEENGHSMAREGAILAAVGVIFALTALQYWLLRMEVFAVPRAWLPFLWVDGVIVYLITLTLIHRRFPKRPGVGPRAMEAAWAGVGIGITVAAIALAVSGWRLQMPGLASGAFPIVLFTLYGTAWGVAFAVRRRTWFALVAIGCSVTAVMCGFLIGTHEEWLVLSLGLFALVAVPGFVILRQARGS